MNTARSLSEQESAAHVVLRELPLSDDVEDVRRLVRATGMFSATEVVIAGNLVVEALQKGEESGYRFLFATLSKRLVGYSCYGAIPATASSFDLYWLAVSADHQRRGLGRRLLAQTEIRVLEARGRRLYVETSCRAQYAPTREFYQSVGFVLAATLEDFYAPGDHKAIYVKILAPTKPPPGAAPSS